jgi:serine/threonine protein kinase
MKEKKTLLEIKSTIKESESLNIVRLIDGFEEQKELFLILELMDGNLKHHLVKIQDLETVLVNIANALKSIHSKGFVHFDIRPGSINKRIFYLNFNLPIKLDKKS